MTKPTAAEGSPAADPAVEFDAAVKSHSKRNFLAILLYQVAHRQGWIFKTESLVISTAALAMGASESMLGLFPFISRLGKFLPQVVAGRAIEPLTRKLPVVVILSFLFGVIWLSLGLVMMITGVQQPWTFWLYLGMYAMAWCVMGATIVGIGTLRGKLIRPDLRGTLLGSQHLIGGVLALSMVYTLHRLMKMDATPIYSFGLIFCVAGALFLVAFSSLVFMKEPPLAPRHRNMASAGDMMRMARELLTQNVDFRRAVGLWFLCNVIFSCLMFYASFGIACVGRDAWKPMIAGLLVAQTMARAVSATIMGQLADRWGNRLVMRILSFALVAWPLMGVFLSHYATPEHPWYWAPVYLMVGIVIPLGPICENYILEVTPIERHASSLGIANGMMTIVAVAPLAVGVLIGGLDIGGKTIITGFGHRPVFIGLAIAMTPAIYFAARLGEPRFEKPCRGAPPPLG